MASEPKVHTIEARTHGRYLVRVPDAPAPWPTIVGFHGYGQNAERHMWSLQQIPGHERWLLVAVQALHPFYHREDSVVANWMTRQDRELAIAENVQYVGSVIDAVRREYPSRAPLVFTGFSQGVAMAYRTAARCGQKVDAMVALAGDVPPELRNGGWGTRPAVLIGRGDGEQWYTEEKLADDLAALDALEIPVEVCRFAGGHEWAPAFVDRAREFLAGHLA